MTVSKQEFRKALSRFATGVTVVTVGGAEGPVHGMTVNAFTSVSLEPLLVLICVDRQAHTHPMLRATKRFGVNVLAEHQRSLAEFYAQAEKDQEDAERLGVRCWRTERGTPMLEDCLAHLECRVVSAYEAGDHTIFIGEVEWVDARDGRPLLFYAGKYRRLGGDAREP